MQKRLSSKARQYQTTPLPDPDTGLGILPPQAIDMEQAVLGAMMLEKHVAMTVLNILTTEDFYLETHQRVMEACTLLYKDGKPVDMRSVVHQLRTMGMLELVGGAYFIAELTSKVSSAANVEHDSFIIKEMAMRRRLIESAMTWCRNAYDDTKDILLLVDEVEKFSTAIHGSLTKAKLTPIKDAMLKLTQDIALRTEDSPAITGIPTGYPKLDRILLGWNKPDLIIMAARPGQGKTSLAVCCSRNAAVDFKIPVAIFSLEMSTQQLTKKYASIDSQLTLREINTKFFDDPTWMQWHVRTSKLQTAPIYIDDTPALSIAELRRICRRYVKELGIGFIVVDYLQLMRGDPDAGNREQEISSISRGLKLIAKELDVPVLALSQLNRGVENRSGKATEPKLADLRESGAIEQDADVVIFIYQPHSHKISHDVDGREFIKGAAKIIVAKHRNGPVGETFLQFIPKFTNFVHVESPYVGEEGIVQEEPQPNMRILTERTEPTKPRNDDETPF